MFHISLGMFELNLVYGFGNIKSCFKSIWKKTRKEHRNNNTMMKWLWLIFSHGSLKDLYTIALYLYNENIFSFII